MLRRRNFLVARLIAYETRSAIDGDVSPPPQPHDYRRTPGRDRRDPGARSRPSSCPEVQSTIRRPWRQFRRLTAPPKPSGKSPEAEEGMMMNDSVLARVAALTGRPTPELKLQWQQLFLRRAAAALQQALPGEPAGVPDPGTGLRRLQAGDRASRLEQPWASSSTAKPIIRRMRRRRVDEKPIAGTRLIREYQGVEQTASRSCKMATSGRAAPTSRCRRSPAPLPAHAGTAGGSLGSRTSEASRDKGQPGKACRPETPLRNLHAQIERGRA